MEGDGFMGIPSEPSERKDVLYIMAVQNGEQFPWLAKMVWPGILDSMQAKVKQFGFDLRSEEWSTKEFTLFGGLGDRNQTNTKQAPLLDGGNRAVEINDVNEEPDVAKATANAIVAIESAFVSIVHAGTQMWALILGFGLFSWLAPDMGRRASMPLAFVVVLFHFYTVNAFSKSLSTLTFEYRPFARMMFSFTGMDMFRIQAVLSAVNVTGKFTRVVFVSKMLDATPELVQSFSIRYPSLSNVGLGGIASIAMGLAVFLAFALFAVNYRKIRDEIALAKYYGEANMEGMMAEMGILADWALLGPIAKVWSVAALPSLLEDLNDAYTVWVKIRTDTIRNFVHVMPDSLMSLYVQVVVFSLSYDSQSLLQRMQVCGSIFATWISALVVAKEMLSNGVYLSVVTGSIVGLCCLDLLARFIGVVACDSHVFEPLLLSCGATM